jgi:hypothetical protein
MLFQEKSGWSYYPAIKGSWRNSYVQVTRCQVLILLGASVDLTCILGFLWDRNEGSALLLMLTDWAVAHKQERGTWLRVQ